MDKPRYQTGAALLEGWAHDIFHGAPPERWPLGPGPLAEHLDFGPGEVLLIGGAPGAGKTAFATAGVFDAVRATDGLRAIICNVEMSPAALLDRELSRLSGIPLSTIQSRQVRALADAGQARILGALEGMADVLARVAFLEPPFDLAHVAAAADDFGARGILLDYVQRIHPPGEHDSQRESLEAMMQGIRNLAAAGAGVLVLSAVARQKGSGGSNYAGLNLASFRGASELEFGADSCYVLDNGGTDDGPDLVALRCVKRRGGEPKDLMLRFERDLMRFNPLAFQPAPAGAPVEYEDDGEAF